MENTDTTQREHSKSRERQRTRERQRELKERTQRENTKREHGEREYEERESAERTETENIESKDKEISKKRIQMKHLGDIFHVKVASFSNETLDYEKQHRKNTLFLREKYSPDQKMAPSTKTLKKKAVSDTLLTGRASNIDPKMLPEI